MRLGRQAPEVPTSQSAGVYFVHPHLPRPNSLGRLFRILLLQESPILLQAAIRPTELKDSEREAIESEIAKCENFLRRKDDPDESGHPSPQGIQKLRAEQLREGLLSQILRLRASAFELRFSIASPCAVPSALAEACGVEITASVADWSKKTLAELQTGGFEVVWPLSARQQRCARAAVRELEMEPWGDSLAPASLARFRSLVDPTEAASVFRLPIATEDGLPGFQVDITRCLPLPRDLARLGSKQSSASLVLGENRYLGLSHTAAISESDRNQHLYVVGQTGTGKTSLLKSMILADIEAGHGLAVIDPHGDLFKELLGHIPAHRADDVVVLDPTDTGFPVGLNLLECQTDDDRYFVVREMRGIMERLMFDQYGAYAGNMTGPLFYQHMQMNLLLAMSNPDEPGTLLEFYELYQSTDYRKRWLPLKWKDAQLDRWVSGTLKDFDYLRKGSEGTSMGEYLSSKFVDFVFDPKLRLIFGQKYSTINFREIMDQGKILLVNLAKGALTEANSRFLGMILMAKIQAAAMNRVTLPHAQRRKFYLYVDEFQSLATEGFITMLSEARKFGLSLVLANQFISQIKDERIMQSVFGNVGTLISMRVGREDAEKLEAQFSPFFDKFDLCNLPNWQACVKTKCNGQVIPPFTLHTLSPNAAGDPKAAGRVRKLSRKKYGRPVAEVLAQITNSLDPLPPPERRMKRIKQAFETLELPVGRVKRVAECILEKNPEAQAVIEKLLSGVVSRQECTLKLIAFAEQQIETADKLKEMRTKLVQVLAAPKHGFVSDELSE